MARITGVYSERVHGWFRLLTESLGRRKHFAVSFLNASHDTLRSKMEEVLILDENTGTTRNLGNKKPSQRLDENGPGVVVLTDNETGNETGQTPLGQTPYTITVNVSRGHQGFGFSVAWTKPPRVERVESGLPADQAGLKPGDYIIFIGQYNVVKHEEEAVLDIIKQSGDILNLEVYRRGVSKPPRGLANGYAGRSSQTDLVSSNETHPRKRLSHITFNTENSPKDRQNLIYALINCEQAFCHACRFGTERYLIPLKFRSDLITRSQHQTLFGNMDQLVDLCEALVDRLMGAENNNDNIGKDAGCAYYMAIEELAEYYSLYLSGLPAADQVLAHKLHDMDFKDFLQYPQVPRRKPDITTFIHKPSEHLREVLGFLTQIYSASPGHQDNTYLDTVLDRLKSCYRGVTNQQNIMEPGPPQLPPGVPGTPPTLRPPLVSVSDIEQRLVFTKFTQPFRLHDERRQWVFGGELCKFEGRHLKPYWAMLFTDLLLFTKINRDRVIFVMEDPVPLSGVCQALFTVKKKPTEFRLIVDTTMRVRGAGSGYLTTPKSRQQSNKNSRSGLSRANKKTLVLRAPTIDLKATWNNLIQRQLYMCQQLPSPQQVYGTSPPSLGRAASTDGLHTSSFLTTNRFCSSVGDLRRGHEEEIELDISDETHHQYPPVTAAPSGSDQQRTAPPVAAQSKAAPATGSGKLGQLLFRRRVGREEELDLYLDDEPELPLTATSPAPTTSTSVPAPGARGSDTGGGSGPVPVADEFILNIEDDTSRDYSSRSGKISSKSKSSSRHNKVKRGGGGGGGRVGRIGRSAGKAVKEEVITLSLDDGEEVQVLSSSLARINSALPIQNHRQDSVPDIVVSETAANANIDASGNHYDLDDDIIIEDERTGQRSQLDKKSKGIGGKVKDKLFPNRHLPKKKKMNRVEKVEKFVDSISVEDLDRGGRVTPVFEREEDLTEHDFAKKRNDLLRCRPKNYMEGAEEVITLDVSTPSTSSLSPMSAELAMIEERKRISMKRKEEKRNAMRLEGIEEESPEHDYYIQKTAVSPEAYEDYIGDELEKDYPELAGTTEQHKIFEQEQNEEQKLLEMQQEQVLLEQQLQEQERLELLQLQEQKQQELFLQEQQLLQQQRREQLLQEEHELAQQQQPTGPLSGSASMSFMDEPTPTGNGNCDFYHQCVAKYLRDPERPCIDSSSVETNSHYTCEPGNNETDSVDASGINLLNNNESITSFATHFRTSCVESKENNRLTDKMPKRTISVSSSTSASANESRNNSTSASEHSSMSISSDSVSSNVSNINKHRSSLFLPTSTTSLPEISIEPPTPQAPKPKDSFDRDNKIKYDLRVPGYRSMFLTVPGFDDDDSDRYLPKYSYDSDGAEHSNSSNSSSSEDDDIVHKPKVFASLTGVAESRGLKRYGSSCDLAQLGVYGKTEAHDDYYNGNVEVCARTSKVGGTGSGSFVADKLAVFEKVAEEEHQKYIELQEVRKRFFRPPKKSGEYIEKFYSPQIIESIDARATEKGRSLRYYDDEYDSYDNPRTSTPDRSITPPSRTSVSSYDYSIPQPSYTTKIQPASASCSKYSSISNHVPRAPSPIQEYRPTSPEDDFDYSTYDFVDDRRGAQSPTSSKNNAETRQCTPTVANEAAATVSGSGAKGGSKNFLDQRTDEVMEMLDSSYLDLVLEEDTNVDSLDKGAANGGAHESAAMLSTASTSRQEIYQEKPPPKRAAPLPDIPPPELDLDDDDVFEFDDDDEDRVSQTSFGEALGPRTKPPPPPPPTDSKKGGFFSRVKKDKDKDKEKDKKEKKVKEKKEKEKKKDKDKDKDKDKPAGKRFQLFGGPKKTSEPSTSAEATSRSPKDKGKRRLFGRGKENFVGKKSEVSHSSDPYVARMSGDSFERDSLELDDAELEIL